MYDLIFKDQILGDYDSPKYSDSSKHRIPVFSMDRRIVKPSGMFTIKLELDEFIQENPGVNVYDASQDANCCESICKTFKITFAVR